MIKQLKMGFKLLRYAHGFAGCMVATVAFFIIGVLLEFARIDGYGTSKYIGVLFVLITGMWPLQMLFSINVSNMVGASPQKKKLQISIPAVLSFWLYLVMYLVVLGMLWIKYRMGVSEADIVTELIVLTIAGVTILGYMGVALKYFWASTVVFFIVINVELNGLIIWQMFNPHALSGISIPVAVLIGFAGVVVGAALYYGLALALYHRPISKYSQISSLRKKM